MRHAVNDEIIYPNETAQAATDCQKGNFVEIKAALFQFSDRYDFFLERRRRKGWKFFNRRFFNGNQIVCFFGEDEGRFFTKVKYGSGFFRSNCFFCRN
jgi:hypothetical protein